MDDKKVYIILGLLLLIGLIPLIKAKRPVGDITGTKFERINGLW